MLGAMLGLCETYVGQFLGPFLRAKNSAIFSAKKLGLELPMLGLFWVMLRPWGPCWARKSRSGKAPSYQNLGAFPCCSRTRHLGPMLSLCWANKDAFLLGYDQPAKERAIFGPCQGHVGSKLNF